jgi:hypothetical protein
VTINHVFTNPAFARARETLMRSATGRELVGELEQLVTHTRIVGVEAARTAPPGAMPKLFGSYHPVLNRYTVDALSLRDDMTAALTIGHEGVHRIRRVPSLVSPILGPFLGIPDAVAGAARAVRAGRNPLPAAARAIDARVMEEEVVAFSREAKIAQELGASAEVAPGLRADGSLKTPDEVLDYVMSRRGYRRQAWVGRAIPVIGLGGAGLAVRELVRDDS